MGPERWRGLTAAGRPIERAVIAIVALLWLTAPLRLAAQELERERNLLARGASTQTNVDNAQTRFDAADANVDVRNAGLPGDTSAQAAARFDWSVVPEADGVVIEVGVNDMQRRLPVDSLEQSLSSTIEAAQARGLWVGLVGMKAPLDADPEYREAFDAVFPDLADAYDIELYSYYFEGLIDPETGDSRPELFLPDGLHPTDAGTSIVAEGMAEWLEDTLPPEAVR